MSRLVLAVTVALPTLLGLLVACAPVAAVLDPTLAARATATPLLASRAALVAARPGAGTDAERCAAAHAGLRLAAHGGREAADLAARVATIPHCEGDTE